MLLCLTKSASSKMVYISRIVILSTSHWASGELNFCRLFALKLRYWSEAALGLDISGIGVKLRWDWTPQVLKWSWMGLDISGIGVKLRCDWTSQVLEWSCINSTHSTPILHNFALNFGVDLTYLALNFCVDLTFLALSLASILPKFNAFNANLTYFQVFFYRKINFFHCFDPYAAKVRNVKSEKIHFLVRFYSAKSNWDHFTISNFSSFFSKS